jgi:hypothetical protein
LWSPSVLNSGADGTYVAGNAKYALPNVLPHDIGWFVSADIGHWFLGTSDSFYGTAAYPNGIPYKRYTNWDVGLAFTWKQFTLDLRDFDTNLSKGDLQRLHQRSLSGGLLQCQCNQPWRCRIQLGGSAFIAKISVDLTSANLKLPGWAGRRCVNRPAAPSAPVGRHAAAITHNGTMDAADARKGSLHGSRGWNPVPDAGWAV